MSFPTVEAYLAALPNGLRSYPKCQTKASIYRQYLTENPLGADGLDGLPDTLVSLLREPVPVSTWLPSVHSLALTMVFRDRFAPTDAAFQQMVYESTHAMYHTPMYRLLMVAVSPSRLLRAASARWGRFNRGSTMTLRNETSTGADIHIDYPAQMYSAAHRPGLVGAYSAALNAAGADNVQALLAEESATHVKIALRWE